MSERGFRHHLEIAGARAALRIIPPLSRRSLLRWSERLGNLAYRFSPHLRRTGEENLRIAFGDSLTTEARAGILRKSFHQFARIVLEAFWFSRDPEKRLPLYFKFDDSIDRALTSRKGTVIITAHYGNWEALGQMTSLRGVQLVSVAAPLANSVINQMMIDLRTRLGQRIIPQKNAIRPLIRELQAGHTTALLLDQNTKPTESGVFVDFFNLPVPVSSAAAWLALRSGANIIFLFSDFQPDGTYRVFVRDLIEVGQAVRSPDPDAVLDLTRRLTAITESQVRSSPEHWLWMYKRWKYVAPGRRREEYPFYSKPLSEPDLARIQSGGT